jgi:5-methyltetrahydropteroyltriglutamate--homocysteine methyltransferase
MTAPDFPVWAGLTSPFPRSERLIAATRDLDRGRTTPELTEKAFVEAETELLALEERLFTNVTAGYLRWNDLFRPIAETWGGFSVGPLTRWLETNTFFRQPILSSEPRRTPGAIAARLPPPLSERASRARVFLPGPYTLARVLENRAGSSDADLIRSLGRLLGDEVRELSGRGYGVFQFTDPFLVTVPPEEPDAVAVLDAYRSIVAGQPGATTIVWTFGAGAGPALAFLDRLPVSVVGIDLTDTEPEALRPGPSRLGLGLGIIDPRTTLPETLGDTVGVVREALRRRPAASLWLGPGAPLDLLPSRPAEQKLLRLSDVRHTLVREGIA